MHHNHVRTDFKGWGGSNGLLNKLISSHGWANRRSLCALQYRSGRIREERREVGSLDRDPAFAVSTLGRSTVLGLTRSVRCCYACHSFMSCKFCTEYIYVDTVWSITEPLSGKIDYHAAGSRFGVHSRPNDRIPPQGSKAWFMLGESTGSKLCGGC